jgi:S1-C subfamily serine protease
VLQVDAHARALTPLPLGNSDSVHVGDSVVAIGNPFGYDRTVTTGIVSALQRVIQAPNSYSIDHVIQTDAALNKGNSGGPLLDARGEVIGVNSQISTGGSGTSGNVGIGFAVPINTVRTVAAQLISSGHVNHAYIGITAEPVSKSAARLFHLPVSHGLLVAGVQSGSGAAKAACARRSRARRSRARRTPWAATDRLGRRHAAVHDRPGRDAIANKQPGTTSSSVFTGDMQEDSDSDIGTAAHDRLTVEWVPHPLGPGSRQRRSPARECRDR